MEHILPELPGKNDHGVLQYAAEIRELLDVIGVQQEFFKKGHGEIDDISIYGSFKIPAMYLSGYHKIHLVRLDGELLKIDHMGAPALCEQYKMIKIMFVREAKVLVDLQIGRKPADNDVVFCEMGNIVNGDILFHSAGAYFTKIVFGSIA
jgi:hypothetical protein